MVFLLFVLLQKKAYKQGYSESVVNSSPLFIPLTQSVRQHSSLSCSLAFFVTSSYVVSHGFFIPPNPKQVSGQHSHHIRLFPLCFPLLNSIGGLPPFVFGSPAKSLWLQVCHIFCNPRSQPLFFLSAPEVVCLHSSKPLNHSPHKIIHLSASLQDFINLSFSITRAKKSAKPSCFQQRSFPRFLILRHRSTLPPSLNSQSARAHRQNSTSIIKFLVNS